MRPTAALQGVVSDMTILPSRIGKVFESEDYFTMSIGVAKTLKQLRAQSSDQSQSSLFLDIVCVIERHRGPSRDPPIHASRLAIQEEMYVALDLPDVEHLVDKLGRYGRGGLAIWASVSPKIIEDRKI
jgi:hypothetical protein